MEPRKSKLNEDAPPPVFKNAEVLRGNMTEAEKLLWEKLRKKQLDGFRFRNQHPISHYILDFYCFKSKLGIEVDGEYHNTKPQQFYDEERTEHLKALGIKIIRFSNQEIFDNMESVLETIKKECLSRYSFAPE